MVGAAIVGLTAFGLVALYSLSVLKVNGPRYREIVADKDLIADVLPPPEFIVETHLVSYQLLDARDPVKQRALFERERELRRVFEERHRYWDKNLDDGPLRPAILRESYEPAVRYFDAFERELTPAIQRGDFAEAETVLDKTMVPLYEQHHRAVASAVEQANKELEGELSEAAGDVTFFTATMIGIGLVLSAVTGIVVTLLGKGITGAIESSIVALEKLARGELTTTLPSSRLDELDRMAAAFNQTADGMRTALGADCVEWTAVGAERAEVGRIRQMVENAPVNMLLADRDLKVTYANPAFVSALRSLGAAAPVAPTALVGASLRLFSGHDGASLSDPARLPLHGRVTLGEEEIVLGATAIHDREGTFIGPMVTWEVVTEKVRAEREVERARAAERELEARQRQAAEERGRAERAQAEREREQANRERAAAQELADKVERVLEAVRAAAAGDLTCEVSVRGDDPIGRVGEALQKLLDEQKRILAAVARASDAVASASEQLDRTSQTLSSTAEQTAAQAQVVSRAAGEVSGSVTSVAGATEEMQASIRQIASSASEGARVAKRGVEMAHATDQTMQRLKESSSTVGQVVKTIRQIAEQTNLLALNATIEAARAGELGKGFAVVANEVKDLARSTALATTDISQRVEGIQHEAESAVAALRSIGEVIGKIDEVQAQIAQAVEEQSSTTGLIAQNVNDVAGSAASIAQNIHGVADAAQETSRGAGETNDAARSLTQSATELNQLIAHFKLDAAAPRASVRPAGPRAQRHDARMMS